MLYIYALAVNNLYKKESAQNCRGFFISFPHICCIPPMMFHKDTTELGIIFVFHAYCLKKGRTEDRYRGDRKCEVVYDLKIDNVSTK